MRRPRRRPGSSCDAKSWTTGNSAHSNRFAPFNANSNNSSSNNSNNCRIRHSSLKNKNYGVNADAGIKEGKDYDMKLLHRVFSSE